MLIILFGQPGAGKNYAGHIFAQDFGFHFHDADEDLPPQMRAAIQHKQMATDAMRAAHVENIITRVTALLPHYPDSVIGGGFFKAWMRQQFLEHFPQAVFVLIESAPEVRRARLQRRDHHLADLTYAEKIFSAFEPPAPGGPVLHNNQDGEDSLRVQIGLLLNDPAIRPQPAVGS